MTVPTIVSGHTTKADTGNTTSRTINVPTYAQNDIIILGVVADIDDGIITVPGGGFSAVYQDVDIKTDFDTLTATASVFWKVASASEGSTYTIATNISERVVAICFAVRGADTSNPINAIGTPENGDSITATVPAVTTTVASCLRISIIGCDQNSDTTPHGAPTGHTKIDDLFAASTGAISAHYKSVTTASTDAAADSTMNAVQEWVGLSFAIAPAGGGGGGGGGGYTPTFSSTKFHVYTDLTDPSIPRGSFPNGEFSEYLQYVGQGNDRMTIVSTPERVSGEKAIRFSIDPAIDPPGEGGRSELMAIAHPDLPSTLKNANGALKHVTGAEYWYGLSIYCPSSTLNDPEEPEVLFQCHSYSTNLNPPFSLRAENGVWTLHVVYLNGTDRIKTTIPISNIIRDAWTDWVFNIFWSHQSNGWLKAYQNGSLVHTHNGPNNYDNGSTGHKVKFGVYKSAWNNTSAVDTWHDRTYYHTGLKVGGSGLTLSDFAADAPPGSIFHLEEDLSASGIGDNTAGEFFSVNWAYVGSGNRRMNDVTSPERVTGNKSIEFSLDPDIDPSTDVDRTQLMAQADPSLPASLRNPSNRLLHSNLNTYWYAYSAYIPVTTLEDPDPEGDENKFEALFEIQSFTSGLDVILSHRINVSNWFLLTSWSSLEAGPSSPADINSVEIDLGSVQRGVWIDWAFKIKWSHLADGRIEVYQNRIKVLDRAGANCFNNDGGFNIRTGIRKPYWKNWVGGVPAWHDRTYNIAEWRIGDGSLTLSDVSPETVASSSSRAKMSHWRQGMQLGMKLGM